MLRKRIELLIEVPNAFGLYCEVAWIDEHGEMQYNNEYESIMIDEDVDRVILEDEIKVHRRAKE